MKLLAALCIAAGAASAATSYTATNLQPAGSPYQVNAVLGLNNKGQVLVDMCTNGNCTGANRLPGVWSNGVITPLPIPSGYSYIAQPAYYHINDSGNVVGTLAITGANNVTYNHVFVWTNGIPAVLPDAPLLGAGNICTTGSAYQSGGSSISYGINAPGHIVGETSYPSSTPGGPSCSAVWVYNGATFRTLEYGPYSGAGSLNWPYPEWPGPIPSPCLSLPLGYYPGVSSLGFGATVNDADVVLQTEQNYFCGPPYTSPGVPWSSDPFVTHANNSYLFLPLGSLAGATATSINDVGDVLGYYGVGGSGAGGLVFWDQNGVHDLGRGGYAYMNQLDQVLYLTTSCAGCGGGIAMWQNGVSTPVQLPSEISGGISPAGLNDAGQLAVTAYSGAYLLSPTVTCAEDVTSQVQITRTGFRYNHSTGLFALVGSVTNTSGSPILGPISLVVDNLSSNASLYGISGDTLCAAPQGSPYIDIGNIGAGQSLAPGASISGAIDFIDMAQTGITYNLRVLAGPGGR
jgi:hypothetical protein